jgi:hypothetical protein
VLSLRPQQLVPIIRSCPAVVAFCEASRGGGHNRGFFNTTSWFVPAGLSCVIRAAASDGRRQQERKEQARCGRKRRWVCGGLHARLGLYYLFKNAKLLCIHVHATHVSCRYFSCPLGRQAIIRVLGGKMEQNGHAMAQSRARGWAAEVPAPNASGSSTSVSPSAPQNCHNFLLNLTDPPRIPQNTDALLKHAQLPGLDGRTSADFSGVRVLIPLCGDTPALKFFAELGCHVTGVELVPTVRPAPSHRPRACLTRHTPGS